MGKYTIRDDQMVDQTVQSHLDCIRETTLRYIHPVALLLAGSFGRGEGSVCIENGTIQFFSDYEICIISSSPGARVLVDKISQELKGKIPVSVSIFWNTPNRIIKNRSRNLSFGKAYPTIGMYELKAGSQFIYGDFDLNKNIFDPSDIPTNEGIRLIINRMMEVIDNLYHNPKPESVCFSLAKLFLACGDALLINAGIYHYSYAERAKRFSKLYKERYASKFSDDFYALYTYASKFKLKPSNSKPFSINVGLPISRSISQNVVRMLLKMEYEPIKDVLYKCASSIPILYQTGKLPHLDRVYENLILGLRAYKSHHSISWRYLPSNNQLFTPFQALYAAIPGLFWGLPLTDLGDKEMIDLAFKWGRWAVPVSKEVKCETLTKNLIEMWHILG